MERFQCIFAKHEGAVTAPTAGMHFSREMMKRLEIRGIDMAFLTLHCGLGNFRNTDVEDLTKHKMDSEQMFVNEECCRIVNKAKDEERKVVAIGTTVQRALEASCSTDNRIKEFEGWTNKFIFPLTSSMWQMPCSSTSTCYSTSSCSQQPLAVTSTP